MEHPGAESVRNELAHLTTLTPFIRMTKLAQNLARTATGKRGQRRRDLHVPQQPCTVGNSTDPATAYVPDGAVHALKICSGLYSSHSLFGTPSDGQNRSNDISSDDISAVHFLEHSCERS